jgi:hypothetical protein
MSNKCCSVDGEGRKDKGGGGGSRSKTSCMWRVVCDKIVCERWCVTKKDGVCEKVVRERCGLRKRCECVRVKEMVSQRLLWKGCMRTRCVKESRAILVSVTCGQGCSWQHPVLAAWATLPDRLCRSSWKRTVCNRCPAACVKATV